MFISDFKGGRPIAYRTEGSLHVGTVWGVEHEKLLKFTLVTPTLHVRPHKSNSQTEFAAHKSPLDAYANSDFYALWSNGKIEQVYLSADEPNDLVNLKKGLISLFQYQLLDGDHKEVDISGSCDVTYTSTSPTSYIKLKKTCVPASDTVRFGRTDVPLGITVNSYRSTSYKLTQDGSLDTVLSRDYHSAQLAANKNVGGTVDSIIALDWDGERGTVNTIEAASIKKAVATLSALKEQPLSATVTEQKAAGDAALKTIVKERVDDLDKVNLGTIASAFTLVDILPIARSTTQDGIVQILKARKTKEHLVCTKSSESIRNDNNNTSCLLSAPVA